jgi:hypothetical protein
MPKRLLLSACAGLMACESLAGIDDREPPAADAGSDQAAGTSGAAAGGAGSGGATAGQGGSSGAPGGASGTAGGGAGVGGAAGGAGGAAGVAGAAASAGVAGACGTVPDGGSAWPDSATAFCSDGQAVVACPGGGPNAGQDGSYQTHPPGYALTGSSGEVAQDLVTGLEWTRDYYGYQTFDEAKSACAADATDGGGWRLPTRLELASIVDWGRTAPALDDAIFYIDTSDRPYWTATEDVLFAANAWSIDFTNGLIGAVSKNLPLDLRCVRGTIAGGLRVSAACESVADERTGLVWMRAHGSPASWLDAIAACEAATADGADDWRLPSVKELVTIVDDTRRNPAVDPNAFPGTPSDLFWASTPSVADPSRAWTVTFLAGGTSALVATGNAHYHRCVRGGVTGS